MRRRKQKDYKQKHFNFHCVLSKIITNKSFLLKGIHRNNKGKCKRKRKDEREKKLKEKQLKEKRENLKNKKFLYIFFYKVERKKKEGGREERKKEK